MRRRRVPAGALLAVPILWLGCSAPPPEDPQAVPEAAAPLATQRVDVATHEEAGEESQGRVGDPNVAVPETPPPTVPAIPREDPASAEAPVAPSPATVPSGSPPAATREIPPEAPPVPAADPSPPPIRPAPVADPDPPEPVETPTGKVIAVAGKPGATRIGADKCKMCHKIQHASWADSTHARQAPVLDCESCHGPGSEYKSMSVMKDPEKAREAGLVTPDSAFCTASCHTEEWQDDMIGRAHAHKEESS